MIQTPYFWSSIIAMFRNRLIQHLLHIDFNKNNIIINIGKILHLLLIGKILHLLLHFLRFWYYLKHFVPFPSANETFCSVSFRNWNIPIKLSDLKIFVPIRDWKSLVPLRSKIENFCIPVSCNPKFVYTYMKQ